MTQSETEITAETPSEPPVLYAVSGGAATITLNRPRTMNSLDLATKEALIEALARAGGDAAVRVVVLTGAGRAFCVGQDLREHAANLTSQPIDEVWSTVEKHFGPIALAIATMPKPVIAMINGPAAGAGLSLAMVCDWRAAADTASFTTAFTGIGLSCDTGSSWTLPRLVGPTKAMELLLWPRRVDAQEALAIGLVNWVYPAAELPERVGEMSRRLANGPTLAFDAVKQSVRFAATHTLEETIAFEAQQMARTGDSADHRAAVPAFLAKQQPVFRGH